MHVFKLELLHGISTACKYFTTIKSLGSFVKRYAGPETAGPVEELIDRLVKAFREALQFLNAVQNQLQSRKAISLQFSRQISDMLRVRDIDKYVLQLIQVGTGDRVMTNAKLFLQTGELKVVKELHSLLLQQSWEKVCHIDLQYLERALLRLLWPLCSAIPKEQHHEVENNLSNIVGSFLRVSISSDPIALPNNPNLSTTSNADQFQVLVEVMITALGCLCR